MVKINRLKEKHCGLYFKNNQDELIFLGNIENQLDFADVTYQIAEENSDKYCILFEEKFYDINRFGVVINYPNDLFWMETDLIGKKFKIAMNRKKEENVNSNFYKEKR